MLHRSHPQIRASKRGDSPRRYSALTVDGRTAVVICQSPASELAAPLLEFTTTMTPRLPTSGLAVRLFRRASAAPAGCQWPMPQFPLRASSFNLATSWRTRSAEIPNLSSQP